MIKCTCTNKAKSVFDALADLIWDFRTIKGIAASAKIPENEVRTIVEAHPETVRRSHVLDKNGSELFTMRSKPAFMRERLAALRMFITNSLE